MRPSTAVLFLQSDILRSDGFGRKQFVGCFRRFKIWPQAADELGIDAAVDDDMCNMDIVRPQLARH